MKSCWFFAALIFALFAFPCARAQQADNATVNAVRTGGSTYFTAKMETLTTKLNLSPDQQAKLKPIAEQEVGLLEEIRGNPELSRKEKLARLYKIVGDSDKQMKPWLSAEQWDKLQSLRKDQREQLNQYAKTKDTH